MEAREKKDPPFKLTPAAVHVEGPRDDISVAAQIEINLPEREWRQGSERRRRRGQQLLLLVLLLKVRGDDGRRWRDDAGVGERRRCCSHLRATDRRGRYYPSRLDCGRHHRIHRIRSGKREFEWSREA